MKNNLKLNLSVVLGLSDKKSIIELENLKESDIIKLDKLCEDPVEIYIGNMITGSNFIAYGEIVVIDNYFGVRITEIFHDKELYLENSNV